jgi:hypothetical protein
MEYSHTWVASANGGPVAALVQQHPPTPWAQRAARRTFTARRVSTAPTSDALRVRYGGAANRRPSQD